MSRTRRKSTRNLPRKLEKGQILILVAFAIVGIVAVIGLTMDVGIMFIEDARLRRAVDSAALAAALQFRQGMPGTQLEDAATEFLKLNGVTLDADHAVTVTTCTDEPDMCYDVAQDTIIPRKLVRIHVNATVHLAFLPVIGIDQVDISADATGESASLDLVLVIDRSESMTSDAPKQDPLRDPTICNDDAEVSALGWGGVDPFTGENVNPADGMPGECHPFEEVKVAARSFLSKLYFPYDRVAIVTFDKTAYTLLNFDENCDPTLPGNTSGECESTDDNVVAAAINRTITDAIESVSVYDADGNICPGGQPCLPYCTQEDIDNYVCNSAPDNQENWIPTGRDDPNAVYAGGFDCGDGYDITADPPDDPSQCTTTNIGRGLYFAGTAFRGSETSTTAIRTSSLWVVVLLTDGAANAATYNDAAGTPACPENTWSAYRPSAYPPPFYAPLCRDDSAETRHCADSATFDTCQDLGNGLEGGLFQNGVMDPNNYDADDSAHDAADYVGLTQGAVIFAIGLGPQVHISDDAGYKLLKYASEKVGNGAYFDAGGGADLDNIFKQIGDKIATRLAH
jgi:hypothetical protein